MHMKGSPRPIPVRSEQLNRTEHTIHCHAIAIISYEHLSVSGFEVLVINGGVDVALVAEKLSSSSGEQDIIHKIQEQDIQKILTLDTGGLLIKYVQAHLMFFSTKPCCPTFFISS